MSPPPRGPLEWFFNCNPHPAPTPSPSLHLLLRVHTSHPEFHFLQCSLFIVLFVSASKQAPREQRSLFCSPRCPEPQQGSWRLGSLECALLSEGYGWLGVTVLTYALSRREWRDAHQPLEQPLKGNRGTRNQQSDGVIGASTGKLPTPALKHLPVTCDTPAVTPEEGLQAPLSLP